MPQETMIRIDGFDRITDIDRTISFDNFTVRFNDNNCIISCPDNYSFLDKYQLEWIFSMLEMFFQYPIINNVLLVRGNHSISDFNELVQNFLLFKRRYDDPTVRNTEDYNNKIIPFLHAINWYHKAHKVYDIWATLSFLSLLTSIDALNGNNDAVGRDFKSLIKRYNPTVTRVQAQRLYKLYRCKIVHQGVELPHDVTRRTLERNEDIVSARQVTEISADENGAIQTRQSQMNQSIVGDITYNQLYKIVSNCLIGFLADYVTEHGGAT